jgi:hypothetical protein
MSVDESKGSQKKMFGGMGKAIGAVGKIGKGTMAGTSKLVSTAQRGLKAVSNATHAATHAAHDGSDEEVDDELRNMKLNELFRSLHLQGGNPHSQLVIATAKGKLVSDWRDEITHEKLVNVNWFRLGGAGSGQSESFIPLGACGSTYQPSVDDIGAKISAQVFDLRNPAACRFTEIGPLLPDGKLVAAVDGILQEKLYKVPVCELKVAPKWAPRKKMGANEVHGNKKADDNSDEEPMGKLRSNSSGEHHEANDSMSEDRGGLNSNETTTTTSSPDLEVKLMSHEVEIVLTPWGMTLSACESDTPRGLHFLLKAPEPRTSATTASLLDGYETSPSAVLPPPPGQSAQVQPPYIPTPTLLIHPEDPLRVDMIFTLDPKRGKWCGLEWFGDNGGELGGYMDLVRDSSNSKIEIKGVESAHDSLLSVTLQLSLPDPHTRDVFTVAARSFTTTTTNSKTNTNDGWVVPWTQHEKSEKGGLKKKQDTATVEMLDMSVELRLTIDHLKGDVARANAETAEAKEEIASLQAQLAASHNTALQTSKQLTVLEGEVSTVKKKAGEASKKSSNKLKEMKETLAKSEVAQQKAIERANEAEKMAAGIEAKLHERVKEAEAKASEMLAELAAKNEECEKLKLDVGFWKRKAESLRKECERGRKTEELAATLTKDLDEEKQKNAQV